MCIRAQGETSSLLSRGSKRIFQMYIGTTAIKSPVMSSHVPRREQQVVNTLFSFSKIFLHPFLWLKSKFNCSARPMWNCPLQFLLSRTHEGVNNWKKAKKVSHLHENSGLMYLMILIPLLFLPLKNGNVRNQSTIIGTPIQVKYLWTWSYQALSMHDKDNSSSYLSYSNSPWTGEVPLK